MDTKEKLNEPSVIMMDTAPDAIDTVCIHKDRFAELVHKETVLDIVRKAYMSLDSYRLTDILDILFDSKKGTSYAE